MVENCGTCRFWDNSTQHRDRPDESGLCRKRPPRRFSCTGMGVWPLTEDADWCGSYERDPDAVEEAGF